MNVYTLLDNVTGNIVGDPVKVKRTLDVPIPVQVTGLTGGTTAHLEGVILEEGEDPLTATWSKISGGKWSSDICEGLYTNFSYIRAVVTNYGGGTVNLRVLM